MLVYVLYSGLLPIILLLGCPRFLFKDVNEAVTLANPIMFVSAAVALDSVVVAFNSVVVKLNLMAVESDSVAVELDSMAIELDSVAVEAVDIDKLTVSVASDDVAVGIDDSLAVDFGEAITDVVAVALYSGEPLR